MSEGFFEALPANVFPAMFREGWWDQRQKALVIFGRTTSAPTATRLKPGRPFFGLIIVTYWGLVPVATTVLPQWGKMPGTFKALTNVTPVIPLYDGPMPDLTIPEPPEVAPPATTAPPPPAKARSIFKRPILVMIATSPPIGPTCGSITPG